jgi:hypothetical protein
MYFELQDPVPKPSDALFQMEYAVAFPLFTGTYGTFYARAIHRIPRALA